MDAEELVLEVKAGSGDAFEKLAVMYTPLVDSMAEKYAALFRRIGEYGDGSLLQDLKQEAQFALYRAAMTYQKGNGSVSFGLYAKVCIRNALVSLVRRVSKTNGESGKKGNRDIQDETDPLLRIINGEGHAQFISQIEKCLSPYERAVFQEMLEGTAPREIARKLSRTPKSVNNTVYRVKYKIKKILPHH